MDFYDNWQNSLGDIIKNKEYTKKFLSKDKESLKVFDNGSYDELIKVCKFLLSIPINNFLYCIEEENDCTTDMIIQYSNLKHAIIDVPKVLKFSNKALTFNEIGKIIVKAKEEGACKKYGENHSKLAEEVSMVRLERSGATYVSITSFGDFSVSLSENDRIELVKRLVLRNSFIKNIIFRAKKNFAIYMDLATSILSKSTANRRKSNVKQLVNLILEDNHDIKNNIVW